MSVKLGVTLPQFTADGDEFRSMVKLVERSGLDSMWVFDHLWPLSGQRDRPILEGWSTLAWLAGATTRIEIGSLVTRSSLRHPVVLAKMAATVAAIAPGRLTVAIGSGDQMSRPENEAFGIPYYADDQRIDQLRSTVEVMRKFFAESTVDHHDEFADITALPVSPQLEEPPVLWIGGRAGDTLEIAATVADGWNGWGGTAERFAQDAGTVLEHAGERPVELSWGGLVVLAADDGAARAAAAARSGESAIVGGPATVAEALNGYVSTGATHIIVTFAGGWDAAALELLAQEVKPLLGT